MGEPEDRYYDVFDPHVHLRQYYQNSLSSPGRVQHILRCYHDAFSTFPKRNLRILDYSSGASIVATISAATKASEIVLSEYSSDCRKVLRQWLEGDPTAFDWTPFFRFVVRDLEGKGEEEVQERQQRVRKLVKDVVHCDITKDPPIESEYDELYDVVICCLVLEGVSQSHNAYVANTSRISRLVKPNGLMLLYGIENKLGYYYVGDRKLKNLHVTHEFALSTLRDAGFSDITIDTYSPTDDPNRVYRFIKGSHTNY